MIDDVMWYAQWQWYVITTPSFYCIVNLKMIYCQKGSYGTSMTPDNYSLGTDDLSVISASDRPAGFFHTQNSFAFGASDAEIRVQSVGNPLVLVGWRISVKSYGTGIVLSVHKVKFRPRHFKIQFDNGESHKLPLQRSEKKGSVPFALLNRVSPDVCFSD